MMLASLAGCISGDEVDDDPTTRIVVASTFHVADIAEALGGSDVEGILLAGSTPAHDYIPTQADLGCEYC